MSEHFSTPAEGFPPHAVAIVGMSGRFPDAPDLGQFWANIRDGVESLRTWSDEEMAASGMPEALRRNPNFVPKGTVLDDADMFDADFFQMSPGEAKIMDPQQRLFLECAWEAMEDAGYAPGRIEVPVGLYAGVSMNSYLLAHVLANRALAESAGGYQLMLGNDKDFLCTRVSYKLDLKGPSVTVQTACSTSLVAVEMACRALARGECDVAMAGGASLNFPQRGGYLYQEGMIFSPDGHCRPFDAAAKGTRAGAGIGLVVLRRLSDALRDGDTIHAMIRGAAVNNDGGAKAGYTAPSIDGQSEAIVMAQTLAGVDPRSIGYMEAHGTGTPLGDPIEIAALTRAFRDRTQDTGFCRLGALKANIGHLDAAAGVAGLIKSVLCLKNAWYPPLVNFREPNPQLSLEASPFAASAEGGHWVATEGPRRAAVSSFGIGGTNAHLILEEAPARMNLPAPTGPQTLVLSARSEAALAAAAGNLAAALERPDAPALADAAHTLLTGRTPFRHRRFVVAGDATEAAEGLRRAVRGSAHDGGARRVAFMFSGQGSQHPGMGRGLYEAEPAYRAAFDTCAEILSAPLGLDLRDAVLRDGTAPLSETWLTQPALFATEYALSRMWAERGIRPAAMIGHSLGEYVAAHLAGVMSIEDALALVALRGRLMQDMAPGSMAAVPLPASQLHRRLGGRAEIAAENAPDLSVISGETAVIAELIAEFEAEGIAARRLHTSHAFHSRMMEPALERMAEAVADIPLDEPAIPYVSNVTGTWITPQEATSPDYYARHLRRAVRFGPGVQLLGEDPGLFLLEVGPGTVLSSLAQVALPASRGRIASSLAHPNEGRADTTAMLEASGRIWAAGVPLTRTGLADPSQRSPRRVSLPTYPFERQRHWVDPAEQPAASSDDLPGNGFVTGQTGAPFLSAPTWMTAPADGTDAEISGRWLVLADTPEVAGEFGRSLKEAGAEEIVPVLPASVPRAGAPALARPGHVEDLKAALAGGKDPVAGIVMGWGLEPGFVDGRGCFDTLVALGHLAQTEPLAAPVRVLCLTFGACSVLGEPVRNPDMALPLGPLLALSSEEPRLLFRLVDLSAEDMQAGPQALAGIARHEARSRDKELLCARRHGRRFHRRYDPVPAPETGGTPLKENGVCLITGGLGGLGLSIARALAEAGPARLVLTGRRALPEREGWENAIASGHPQANAMTALREIEKLGAEVMIATCDVAVEADMQALAGRIRARWGRLDGLIHAAGLAGSGALTVRQTREEINATLSAKVEGTRTLGRVFGGDSLDFVVLMSSINSIISRPGAVDYAAANAFMDAWAESDECPAAWPSVRVMNWEAWAEVGMAARRQKDRPDPGLTPIDRDVATRLLLDLAGGTVPRVIITPYDLSAAAAWRRRAGVALGVDPRQRTEDAALPLEAEDSDLVKRDRFASDAEVTVARIWADLLQVPLEGPEDDFFELGGHSLMATRLLAQLEAATSVRLMLRDVFEARTIGNLAALVEGAVAAEPVSGQTGEEIEEFVL
ncbi:type I polyketide synthase [Allosediminivita pacifica]|uniref:Acyl transferase domain-containing protein n=1 Tax=Allosediminivita pacifica TaxID=1267769 RepID=A0A2T6B7E4_9RHOB|nr:type I polyketide synthase [Allosediminivita pacifica]PTX51975.1 acyl transferase domain-containing protein [Allosediminivita pacifica]GGA98205.1 hypothetical protein GCM10011324_05570 [Allosediminivita pacifica]